MINRFYGFLLAHAEGEEGAHGMEYALIATLIALVMALGATSLGQTVQAFYIRIYLGVASYIG